jgi:micrococcal nuclease
MFEYMAIVDRVVDGDTVDVRIDLGFDIWHKVRLRLAHIDAAEKNTPRGKATLEALKIAISGKTVKVQTTKPDKYGRYLAEIWTGLSAISINGQLTGLGIAKVYEGDSKSNLWTEEELADVNISKLLI